MSSKGNIGLKRFISHSPPTSTSQRQHNANNISICTTMPKPIPKQKSKHLIFGDSFVKGIHAEVMSTSDEEKVEIFSWSGVRMEHLIDKILNVPLDSLTGSESTLFLSILNLKYQFFQHINTTT